MRGWWCREARRRRRTRRVTGGAVAVIPRRGSPTERRADAGCTVTLMLPADVLELAARLPGHLISAADVATLRYSRHQLTRWVAAGDLTRVVRGLHRPTALPVLPVHDLAIASRYCDRPG